MTDATFMFNANRGSALILYNPTNSASMMKQIEVLQRNIHQEPTTDSSSRDNNLATKFTNNMFTKRRVLRRIEMRSEMY